jgi:hypothetical protein
MTSLTSAQNWYLILLTLVSLVACLVFVAIRAGTTLNEPSLKAKGISLRSRMGQGSWDFSQSFATNIAIIGSVLTLVLTSGALPSTTSILPSSAYGGLAVFFGSVVVIAPLLYNGTAKRVPVSPGDVDTAAEYHGTVWGFLLAALLTEWGLLGSIATVFVTLLELYNADSLSVIPLIVLAVTLFAAIVFFACYSWVKIDGTIADQFDPAHEAARATRNIAARRANNLTVPTAENSLPPPPSPRWTLL